MPAFEWVHVQLHQQKGMISLSPPTICNSALYSKAKSYEAGERVEFGGKSFAPLYTPKNDTLINLFQISQQEQEQLKTIISTDEAQKRRRERDRLRDEERRRAAGQLEREAYEANSLSRQKPREAMGMSRAKWYRPGKPSPQQNSETSPSLLLMAKPQRLPFRRPGVKSRLDGYFKVSEIS
ncbi:hypothetical protein RAG25_22695 [Klebsiella pneumoniae]